MPEGRSRTLLWILIGGGAFFLFVLAIFSLVYLTLHAGTEAGLGGFGDRIGVDASTMEANAALRAIVRRDTGESYREVLTRMAQESGIETPTAQDLIRLDRKRTGKRLSNDEWVSETDPDARIARMKDGTTHLAYKPEHAVDLDTGAVLAAEVHPADQGDTTTITSTLDAAQRNLTRVGAPPDSVVGSGPIHSSYQVWMPGP